MGGHLFLLWEGTLTFPFLIEDAKAFVALVVGFVILLWVLGKVNIPYLSLPYFRTMLGERASRIEEAHNQVQRALEEAQQVRNDYATRLTRIEEEARAHIDAAVKEADVARAEIIAEAQQSAQGLRRRAEEEIARERQRARIQLRRQIVQITMDAAGEAARTHSNEVVQRQLIRDFIARAGADGNGHAAGASAPAPPPTPRRTQG
ncbi:MAG TPA: ATP synthase F0 subunit B [Chthonomonadaceae bacterium]|nr:ATP synthase F0 subunit B [Chthonomonadaceae bacterium]